MIRHLAPLLLIATVVALSSCSSTMGPRERTPGPHRVACVGDSITYGEKVSMRDLFSYPAQLQRELGSDFQVRNFGVPKTTAIHRYVNSYARQPAFDASINFEPDTVFLMLGTNDSRNWTNTPEFEADYVELVQAYRSRGATVYAMLPLSVGNDDVTPAVRRAAATSGAGLIRLPFENISKADGIHPDATGASVIARSLAPALRSAALTQAREAQASETGDRSTEEAAGSGEDTGKPITTLIPRDEPQVGRSRPANSASAPTSAPGAPPTLRLRRMGADGQLEEAKKIVFPPESGADGRGSLPLPSPAPRENLTTPELPPLPNANGATEKVEGAVDSLKKSEGNEKTDPIRDATGEKPKV